MVPDPPFLLYGVLHLRPLPGAPTAGPGFAAVRDRALHDVEVLSEAGFSGCVLENFGDAPFGKGAAEPHVLAYMAVLASAVRAATDPGFHLGVNILRNDVLGALGVAAASQADFVRANVLSGSAWTDQGLIEGQARAALKYRRLLENDGASPIRILADVHVKHATPAGGGSLAGAASDLWRRGGADGLILTGSGTGAPTASAHLEQVERAAPGAPLWVGSGLTPSSILKVLPRLAGAIVGTYVHEGGQIAAPLDPARARALVEAVRR